MDQTPYRNRSPRAMNADSTYTKTGHGSPQESLEFPMEAADRNSKHVEPKRKGFSVYDMKSTGWTEEMFLNGSGRSVYNSILQQSNTEKNHEQETSGRQSKHVTKQLRRKNTVIGWKNPRSPRFDRKTVGEELPKRLQIQGKPASSHRRMSCPDERAFLNIRCQGKGDAKATSGRVSDRKERPSDSVTQDTKDKKEFSYVLPKITEAVQILDFQGEGDAKRLQQDQLPVGRKLSEVLRAVDSEYLTKHEESNRTLPQMKECDGARNQIDKVYRKTISPRLLDTQSIILETKNWIRKNHDGKRRCIDFKSIQGPSETAWQSTAEEYQLDERGVTNQSVNEVTEKSASMINSDNTALLQPQISRKKSLECKIEDFLQKQQPSASPETLMVKKHAARRKRPAGSTSHMDRRRGHGKPIVNTETCPSLSLTNQDRSWYFQDKTGKCRYLRMPESPVPPIEWIFEKD